MVAATFVMSESDTSYEVSLQPAPLLLPDVSPWGMVSAYDVTAAVVPIVVTVSTVSRKLVSVLSPSLFFNILRAKPPTPAIAAGANRLMRLTGLRVVVRLRVVRFLNVRLATAIWLGLGSWITYVDKRFYFVFFADVRMYAVVLFYCFDVYVTVIVCE